MVVLFYDFQFNITLYLFLLCSVVSCCVVLYCIVTFCCVIFRILLFFFSLLFCSVLSGLSLFFLVASTTVLHYLK